MCNIVLRRSGLNFSWFSSVLHYLFLFKIIPFYIPLRWFFFLLCNMFLYHNIESGFTYYVQYILRYRNIRWINNLYRALSSIYAGPSARSIFRVCVCVCARTGYGLWKYLWADTSHRQKHASKIPKKTLKGKIPLHIFFPQFAILFCSIGVAFLIR